MTNFTLLTAKQLGEKLGFPYQAILRLTRDGTIPAIQFGKRVYRYDPDKVKAAFERLSTDAKNQLAS